MTTSGASSIADGTLILTGGNMNEIGAAVFPSRIDIGNDGFSLRFSFTCTPEPFYGRGEGFVLVFGPYFYPPGTAGGSLNYRGMYGNLIGFAFDTGDNSGWGAELDGNHLVWCYYSECWDRVTAPIDLCSGTKIYAWLESDPWSGTLSLSVAETDQKLASAHLVIATNFNSWGSNNLLVGFTASTGEFPPVMGGLSAQTVEIHEFWLDIVAQNDPFPTFPPTAPPPQATTEFPQATITTVPPGTPTQTSIVSPTQPPTKPAPESISLVYLWLIPVVLVIGALVAFSTKTLLLRRHENLQHQKLNEEEEIEATKCDDPGN